MDAKSLASLLERCRDRGGRVISAEALVAALSEIQPSRAEGIRLQGQTFRGNNAWINSAWDFPMVFESCQFLDCLDLSGAHLLDLTLKDVTSPEGIRLAGASVTRSITLETVSAGFVDATLVRIGETLSADGLQLKGSMSFPGRDVLTSLSLNMAEIRTVKLVAMNSGGCCNFFRGRFDDLTIRDSFIAHSAGLSHETRRFVELNQSTPLTHSGLWLSQLEVSADVSLGPNVVVTGDVRLVGAKVGKSLRIGVDNDWGKRQAEGFRGISGHLTLVGGYLNLLRCEVGERTEIAARLVQEPQQASTDVAEAEVCDWRTRQKHTSGETFCERCERSPVLILNEGKFGDLALHGLSLGEGSGLVSLDGATYSNIEVSWIHPQSSNVQICGAPRGRAFSPALFALPVVRSYEKARSEQRKAELERLRKKKHSASAESVSTSLMFRSSNYRQLARVLSAQGRDQAAQSVLISMHRDQRHWESRGMGRLWSGVRDHVTLYGFALSRVFWGLAVVILLAVGVVYLGQVSESFLATQPSIVVEAATQPDAVAGGSSGLTSGAALSAAECTDSYPCMNAALYTIDQLIPILTLGQVDYWQPRGSWWGKWVLVILTGLAWVGTTVLIAGLGSLTRELSETDATST